MRAAWPRAALVQRSGVVLLAFALACPTVSGASAVTVQRQALHAPANEGPRKGADDNDDENAVVVTRSTFEERLRGKQFQRWRQFRDALGSGAASSSPPRDVGGAERVMGGLSIVFVVIVNALMWSIIIFVVWVQKGSRVSIWSALGLISLYGCGMYAYCDRAYGNPEHRLIANFLFGAVPFAVSACSYIIALLTVDLVRCVSQGDWDVKIQERLKPWNETLVGRVIFFLAVLPGLAVSIHLSSSVSSGFRAWTTHFDVLSLCLFVDVGRFCGHLVYVLAPRWAIGESQSNISERPGLLYVFWFLCLGWYMILAHLEAGSSVVLADRTKIHTLVALTSTLFFPISLHLSITRVRKDFPPHAQSVPLVCAVLAIGAFMMLVGMVFDSLEANLMSIASLLWVIFYVAFQTYDKGGGFFQFVAVMFVMSVMIYVVVLLSVQHAHSLREAVLGVFAL